MQVRDVMTTDIKSVGPGSPIDDAIAIMTGLRVSGVPVVDEQGVVVGILTEGDLLRRFEIDTGGRRQPLILDLLIGQGQEAANYVRTHSRRVSDLMTEPVFTVTESDPLSAVVRLMERRRIRRVPVLRDGRLVGIVSRFDLIAAVGRKLAEPPSELRTDAGIAAEVERELACAHWLGQSSIGVQVKDGVATLDGVIEDERIRQAIRVAAQNVSGVTAIRDRIAFIEPMSGAIAPA
jgi:CBS domain-containing protein